VRLKTIWTLPGLPLRERLHRTSEWSMRKLAQRMPRRLAYWVLIDAGANHMENDVVPEVTFMTVLKRFERAGGAPR